MIGGGLAEFLTLQSCFAEEEHVKLRFDPS